jgi:transposase
MHPNPKQRRVHSAEFKAEVLAACRRPGASVAAVALSHGLNVNLVRKWLVGRGLKRCGQAGARGSRTASRAPSAAEATTAIVTAPALQFVPVELSSLNTAASASSADSSAGPRDEHAGAPAGSCDDIHIELRRGAAQLTVRWPSSQATSCAAWLRELAATALK